MTIANRPLDLLQLRAALAIRETGTVTRAASHLGLSQPAVSRLIAALEAELGFLVFERLAKRMVLSERGRQFLDESEAAMRSMARLRAVAGELRRGNHGLLRIGAIAPLALSLVTRAVAAHRRAWPKVTIDVEVRGRQAQLEELRAGRIDIGLAAMPIAGAGLRVEPILEADAACLLPANHALARRTVLSPSDLAEEALVLTRPDSIIRQRLDDAFRQAGLVQQVAAIVDSTPVGISLVALGAGIAVTHAFPKDALPANVVQRRFRPRISFTYAMITQDDGPRSSAVAQFGAALRAVARASHRPKADRHPLPVPPKHGLLAP